MQNLLNDVLESQLDLHFSKQHLSLMCNYWEAVKNAPLNLTAIKDDRRAVLLHLADSLAPLHFLQIPDGASLIDVGTGGGFPAIPLSVAREDLQITAIDGTKKKLTFIEQHMPNPAVRLIHARAEELAHQAAHREQYDFACARAVAASNILLEYLSPFVRVGGTVIIYKSELSKEEQDAAIKAAPLLRLEPAPVIPYTLSLDETVQRTLWCFTKTAHTPEKYPRKQVRTQPLGL